MMRTRSGLQYKTAARPRSWPPALDPPPQADASLGRAASLPLPLELLEASTTTTTATTTTITPYPPLHPLPSSSSHPSSTSSPSSPSLSASSSASSSALGEGDDDEDQAPALEPPPIQSRSRSRSTFIIINLALLIFALQSLYIISGWDPTTFLIWPFTSTQPQPAPPITSSQPRQRPVPLRPLSECGYTPSDFTFVAFPDAYRGLNFTKPQWEIEAKDIKRRLRELQRVWHPDKARYTGLEHWQHERITALVRKMAEDLLDPVYRAGIDAEAYYWRTVRFEDLKRFDDDEEEW